MLWIRLQFSLSIFASNTFFIALHVCGIAYDYLDRTEAYLFLLLFNDSGNFCLCDRIYGKLLFPGRMFGVACDFFLSIYLFNWDICRVIPRLDRTLHRISQGTVGRLFGCHCRRIWEHLGVILGLLLRKSTME
jgi:hypothetical protein